MKKVVIYILSVAVAAAFLSSCSIQSVEEHDSSVSQQMSVDESEKSTQKDRDITKKSGETSSLTEKLTEKEERSTVDTKKPTAKTKKDKKEKTTTSAESSQSRKNTTTAKKDDGLISVSVQIDSSSVKGIVDNPPNGSVSVRVNKTATAFDVTRTALSKIGVSIGYTSSAYGVYVESIGGLSEKLSKKYPYSGWKYYINGVSPPKACSEQSVSDGDSITWKYVLTY